MPILHTLHRRGKGDVDRRYEGTACIHLDPTIRQKVLVLLLAGSLMLCACGKDEAFKRIQKTGTITVITRNNAHSYHTYRDQEMGFEYDLARAFADFLNVRLKVEASDSWDQMLLSLTNGTGDVLAASTTTPSPTCGATATRRGRAPSAASGLRSLKSTRSGGSLRRSAGRPGRADWNCSFARGSSSG